VKHLRLIPLVVVAALGLLTMKVLELFAPPSTVVRQAAVDPITTGAVTPKPRVPAKPNDRTINLLSSWSVSALTDPGVDPIVTGSEGEHKEAPNDKAAPAEAQTLEKSDVPIKVSTDKPTEAKPLGEEQRSAESRILQLLGDRRKQIEAREHEVDIREGLLKATESKIEQRIDDLKVLEDKVGAGAQNREDKKVKELADLVKMYESMKPKDAARVFDRLDATLLVDIARQMNPKKLGDVVAKMSPDVAEKLTIGLANRKASDPAPGVGADLPKIEGHDS
jgi:flagellar motility protein MotE (MotC chaperone)